MTEIPKSTGKQKKEAPDTVDSTNKTVIVETERLQAEKTKLTKAAGAFEEKIARLNTTIQTNKDYGYASAPELVAELKKVEQSLLALKKELAEISRKLFRSEKITSPEQLRQKLIDIQKMLDTDDLSKENVSEALQLLTKGLGYLLENQGVTPRAGEAEPASQLDIQKQEFPIDSVEMRFFPFKDSDAAKLTWILFRSTGRIWERGRKRLFTKEDSEKTKNAQRVVISEQLKTVFKELTSEDKLRKSVDELVTSQIDFNSTRAKELQAFALAIKTWVEKTGTVVELKQTLLTNLSGADRTAAEAQAKLLVEKFEHQTAAASANKTLVEGYLSGSQLEFYKTTFFKSVKPKPVEPVVSTSDDETDQILKDIDALPDVEGSSLDELKTEYKSTTAASVENALMLNAAINILNRILTTDMNEQGNIIKKFFENARKSSMLAQVKLAVQNKNSAAQKIDTQLR